MWMGWEGEGEGRSCEGVGACICNASIIVTQ